MDDTKQDIDIKVETEEEVKTKRCSKCGRILPLSEFYRDKYRKDGKRSICMDCVKLKRKEYCKSHREEVHKSQAKWRAKHPNYDAEYYKANKEKKAAYNAEWYQTHRDSELKKRAEYRDPILNPLNWARKIVCHYRDMDRERGFDTSKTVTAEWFLENIMYKPCAHCGLRQVGAIGANRLNNDIGHESSNLEPCCMPCNARENIRDQIARGLAWFQKGKKQSFSSFVEEHKEKDKKD